VYGLINEQVRMARFKIGIEMWASVMEEGKKEEPDYCMMNPGMCSAHSDCILYKDCRRHEYKNRNYLFMELLMESCQHYKILVRLMQTF
jgi:hypothetical protein